MLLVSSALELIISAVAAVLLCSPQTQAAERIHGRVIHVVDGDGLVLMVGERRLNIRLADIDAPEQRQPYGIQARQSLSAMCGGQLAQANVSGKDRNSRSIAQVTCGGTHANAEQVRRGMAWVFERYAPLDSPLYRLQEEARAAHRGLWAQTDPVPPWVWRNSR